MRALFLDIERPIESRLLDPSSSEKLGQGATSRSASLAKPIREFTLKSWDTLLLAQAEKIRNEIHAARITGVFWLFINGYNEATEPIFIGQGNGSQTEFPAPYNDILAPTWKLYVNQTLTTGWTAPGGDTFKFISAPTGRITGIGKRKFRVVITENNESILSESQIFSGPDGSVYVIEPLIFTEAEGVNVA